MYFLWHNLANRLLTSLHVMIEAIQHLFPLLSAVFFFITLMVLSAVFFKVWYFSIDGMTVLAISQRMKP